MAPSQPPKKKGDLWNQLKKTLDEAEWTWVAPHAERGAVIVVTKSLDLLDVGMAIATDEAARVQGWIETGQIAKPTSEQLLSWKETPSRRFLSLVVQPYVLIQEMMVH